MLSILGKHHLPTTNTMKRSCSSWEDYQEEAAFANGTIRGAQGGSLVWPQRSYSCSFCRREFRSAQALGGHMNVHRRDKALLKQVHTDDHHDHDNLHQNHHHRDYDHDHDHDHVINQPSKSMLPRNPSQVCGSKTSVARLSLSRVSSNSVISGVKKVISSTNDVVVQAKLSMGLDLAIGTYRKEEDYQEVECLKNNKRFKKNCDYNVALIPFFEEIRCSNAKDNSVFLQVPKISSLEANKSMEELDLELRLGHPLHKVK